MKRDVPPVDDAFSSVLARVTGDSSQGRCPACGGIHAAAPPAFVPFGAAGRVSPTELGSMVWALAPLVTVGLAAGPCFAYAAVRRRSRGFGLAALVYSVASIAIVWGNVWSPGNSVELNVGALAVLAVWTVSSIHALAVRRRVFFDAVEGPVAAARARIRRRDDSRRIAVTDPRLAKELQIGRPDQPSDYDDGGLLDVNHLPEEYLREASGLDPELVRSIVEARAQVGGFESRHDLETIVGLDPRTLDQVADRLLFCREP